MTMRDGWISVEERLPDDPDNVLVRCENNYIIVAFRDDGYWMDSSECRTLNHVTHWQPIEGPGE